jgi:hypothetical protein
VIVQATLSYTNDWFLTNATLLAEAGAAIQWTGGQAVPGNPLQRRVSKTNSVETTVTASLSSTTTNLNVWVIWANLTIKTSGTLDPNDKADVLVNGNSDWPTPTIFTVALSGGSGLGGGNSLGPIDCLTNTNLDYSYTIGRMEAKAILQPSGIGNILTGTNTWNMKRTKLTATWDNGQSDSPAGGDDTSFPQFKHLNPTNGDIFDLDTPGCSAVLSGTNIIQTAEVYEDFYEYVTVNLGNGDQTCSDTNTWSYTAQVDVDNPTNKVQLNSLSTSLITLPTTPHYSQR